MISFSNHMKFYIYRGAVDMRKGYDGLSGLVRNEIGENPLNGHAYVFFNRTRHLVKILVWDKDGFVIYGKRLERGSFEQLEPIMQGKKYGISYHHLIMLLSGISLLGMKQKLRYKMPEPV
jgi:transposase